jgi:hypothetical protein
MEQERYKELGPITINYPDENNEAFIIEDDCDRLFGYPEKYFPFELLKDKLKDAEPKPIIEYDGHLTTIISEDVDTIILCIQAVIELSVSYIQAEFPALDVEALRAEFTLVKENRPLPKK